jgi:tRNA G26 N,N-dimethylase Trm1
MITAAEARKTYETTTDSQLKESLEKIDKHIQDACFSRRSLVMNSDSIKGDQREIVKNLEARGFKAKFNFCQRDGSWLEVSW